ncbi:CPBP family glutamic-type intramembrane protease [Pseudoxanthomonas putridarboris]|uniref:CPBP family glutamic-type intramembrane protease n=1 Tax=Pseudoxanthomonas putridarboris TaxID=752605 RepID=A0ABU9J2I5_9GAMM
MKEYLRKKGIDERSAMLIAGIVATVLAGILIAVGRSLGAEFSKPVVELTLFAILVFYFPERDRKSWGISSLFLSLMIGIFLGLTWIVLFGYPKLDSTEFRSLADFSFSTLLYGFSASFITAPLFEEKVVRHLLLEGLGKLHAIVASLLVSCVFALVHVGSVIWAFLASMLLCFSALCLKMTSAQRAISHGVCNLLIAAWYYTNAYGIR